MSDVFFETLPLPMADVNASVETLLRQGPSILTSDI
jgi:hypothetical protein